MENVISEQEFFCAIDLIKRYKIQLSEQFKNMETTLESNKFSELELNNDTPISKCGLSVKTLNILKQVEIFYLSDLKKLTTHDLMKLRGMGKVGLKEVQSLLLQCGLVTWNI